MTTRNSTPTISQHFAGRAPAVRAIYDRILTAAKAFGPVGEEPKKTSIHLTRRSAFAGVATRKDALILTIKSPADIRSARIVKHAQASASRWYLDVRLDDPAQVDRELKGWLKQSIELSA